MGARLHIYGTPAPGPKNVQETAKKPRGGQKAMTLYCSYVQGIGQLQAGPNMYYFLRYYILHN